MAPKLGVPATSSDTVNPFLEIRAAGSENLLELDMANPVLAFKAQAQAAAAGILRVPPTRVRIELQDTVVLVSWPESTTQQKLWDQIEKAVDGVLPETHKHFTVEVG